MKRILLASTAAIGWGLSGCSDASGLSCSGHDDILKTIEKQNGINLVSVDAIVQNDHHDNTVECEATLHTDGVAINILDIADTFRVHYSVSRTEDNKIWVQITHVLSTSLSEQAQTKMRQKMDEEVAKEKAEQAEEEAARKQAEAEQARLNTLDTTASCDSVDPTNIIPKGMMFSNTITVSPGICTSYFVLKKSPSQWKFGTVDYKFTVGGVRVSYNGQSAFYEDYMQYHPYKDQVSPPDMVCGKDYCMDKNEFRHNPDGYAATIGLYNHAYDPPGQRSWLKDFYRNGRNGLAGPRN